MESVCDGSNCEKMASKKCSQCKSVSYCSRDCQRTMWREHKNICREIVQTREKMESEGQGLVENSGLMDPILQMYKALEAQGKMDGSGMKYIPEFHKEYQQRFPKDKRGFEMLKNQYGNAVMLMMMEKNRYILGTRSEQSSRICLLDSFGTIENILQKRWGGCLSSELLMFLRSKPSPGEVFLKHPALVCGQMYGDYYTGMKWFQTMRNTWTQPDVMQRGHSYVSIGFVDLQQVLEAEIVGKEEEGSVSWFGYEMSVIAVARAKLILKLLKSEIAAKNILQVWFSSCINTDTAVKIKDHCKDLEITEDNPDLKMIFKSWSVSSVSVGDAKAAWMQHLSQSQLSVITKLKHKQDRTDYARYLFTGEIFLQEGVAITGNVTFFNLPVKFKDLKRTSENFFHSFNVDCIEYKTSLVRSVEEKFIGLVDTLRTNLITGAITVTLNIQKFEVKETETFKQIQRLNPTQIDWSNIPDYLKIKDFFLMARLCSGSNTKHCFHLMNWIDTVFGCNITDYVSVEENYDRINLDGRFSDRKGVLDDLMETLRKEFVNTIKTPNFVSCELIKMSCDVMEISQTVLTRRFLTNYIEFMFQGQSVAKLEYHMRPYSLFERSSTVADVVFYYKC